MRARWLLGVVAICSLGIVAEREAQACGGCFSPPPPPPPTPRQPSVVTDHRMVLSIGQQQTTLYDELRYTGDPESFAWVLPITGTAKIGISSDGVFATLDAMTQVTVIPPPVNCPTRPQSCTSNEDYAEAPNASAGSSSGGGVTVTAQETVGPYETVQLKADDGQALNDWLKTRGYVIPDDVKPVISAYVAEHFDFLALKLVPGTGVQAMRPVRVSTSGASTVLPLRMVAAGTGAKVGIVLWTVAEGRYEPQNFPFFSIKANELEWDWTKSASNLADLRTDRENTFGGRGWELESSVAFSNADMRNAITNGYCQPYRGGYGGYYGGGYGGGAGAPASYGGTPCSRGQNNYEAEDAGPGAPPRTKEVVAAEDLETLVGAIPKNVRITRFRASLAHQALDQDLVLSASTDQSLLDAAREVTREKNQPICPVYAGCEQIGTAPRDEALARSGQGTSESFGCSVKASEGHRGRNVAFGAAAFAALALLVGKRLRKR